MLRKFSVALGLLWLLTLLTTVVAQTSRGTLTGTIMDSSGAVIPNAVVKITQQETGVTRQTATNSAGIYRFDAVDLGTYTVSAHVPGFSTQDKKGIAILAAHTTNIGFSLQIEGAKEVVTVEASGVDDIEIFASIKALMVSA